MNKKENISKLVDEALNSMDDVKRAEPRPFLFTRIHARMNRSAESVWEKAGWFIGRPVVAFTGLCLVVLINLAVIMFNEPAETAVSAEQSAQSDEFSYTVATIYDIENNQP